MLSNYFPRNDWYKLLKDEFSKDYFKAIEDSYFNVIDEGKVIYPLVENIFNAFALTDFKDVRVVILGQDPYHNKNQAMGLSFSVPKSEKTPPSLQRIYKEISSTIDNNNKPMDFSNGDLTHWSNQGVLLLNAILTVEEHKPLSHKNWGWEVFTDRVISIISEKSQDVVFLLWGRFAQDKSSLIDGSRHLILKAPHPSPLAQGFLGCNHFVKTNEFLSNRGKREIRFYN